MGNIFIIKDLSAFDECSRSGSEERITYIGADAHDWTSADAFCDAIAEFARGERRLRPASDSEFLRFLDDMNTRAGHEIRLSPAAGAHTFTTICDDWDCRAVMWTEQQRYFAICWSTSA